MLGVRDTPRQQTEKRILCKAKRALRKPSLFLGYGVLRVPLYFLGLVRLKTTEWLIGLKHVTCPKQALNLLSQSISMGA